MSAMNGHTSLNGFDRTIFVFDDDRGFRDGLFRALNAAGYRPVSFADGPSLLAAARRQMPLCIVIEVHLQNGRGIGILRELRAQEYPVPVLATSRGGDIPTAVSALKLGAMDLIQKPLQMSELLARIDEVVRRLETRDSASLSQGLETLRILGRGLLSDRELQIAEHIVSGTSSKQTAKMLGISPRTVDDHRHRIMHKIGARNVADVVRLLLSASHASS
jgi:FixJ family two-component response regulator